MLSFIARRLGLLIPTFFGVTLLTFALIRLIPGDPVEVMMGERRVDPEMHAQAMERLRLQADQREAEAARMKLQTSQTLQRLEAARSPAPATPPATAYAPRPTTLPAPATLTPPLDRPRPA